MIQDGAELNTKYPKRSQIDYREANKDKIAKINKKYYDTNRELIAEKTKIYNDTHKEQKREYDKEYIKKNKEKIRQRANEKITCDICSKMMSKSSMARHKKTQHSTIDENTHPF